MCEAGLNAMELPNIYSSTLTVLYFKKMCKFAYLASATNYWFEEQEMPKKFINIYKKVSKVLEVILACFVASQWGSYITQKNMTEKQRGDRLLFSGSHTVLYIVYISAVYHRHQIRRLVFTLTVTLGLGNDEGVKKAMIRKVLRYSMALAVVCGSTLVTHGVEMGTKAIKTNATFTTVVMFWPDVEDRRAIAGAARVLTYITFWLFVVRIISCYFIILAITICLGHQFTSLHNYFLSLNDIFEGDGSQNEKEKRYEDALKVGIKMHSTSLWCVRQMQETCSVAFSGQIILNVSVLFLLLIQMMSVERTLVSVAPVVSMAASVLVGTGIFMWNAGDVTVEADKLPTAMFLSGWHRCRAPATVRIRRLVCFAVTQAQKPVIIKVLGVIGLSYQSYLSIVKSSYSLFSVIY